MRFLAGLNSNELRRLQPFLSYLLSEMEALKKTPTVVGVEYGTDADILPTDNENRGGILSKVARADHTHLFRFPTAIPTQLPPPDGTAYFDVAGGINIFVGGSPTTKVVASALLSDIQPTGVKSTGTAERYALADHSHSTAILEQNHPQTPALNEIRYNDDSVLVRWDGGSWVPLSVGTLSNNPPPAVGGNSSAGTSEEYSRADHTHRIVLERDSTLTSPANRQLGVWALLDDIGDLCLAIYNQTQLRWELPFARPLLSQTTGVPSGKAFHTSLRSELALRTDTGKQGFLYFRRYKSTTWQPVGTILSHESLTFGLLGELVRSSASISPSGQWYLQGVDGDGDVRALPLSIRTYNQDEKPTTNLPNNMEDAYGFFIQDRRLIEFYPQVSDGITRPIIITGFQYSIPAVPSYLYNTGANNIESTNSSIFPVLRFVGSTSNTNLPAAYTTMRFLPMGIRRVRLGVIFKAGHTSGSFTYRFDLRIISIQSDGTSLSMGGETGASLAFNPSQTRVYLTPSFTLTLTALHSNHMGTPFVIEFRRRWDLESSNTHPLIVYGYVVVPVRE